MVCDVLVSGPACGERAIVEPLSVAIEGNLQVANILVNATKTCYTIQVANPTSKDNWLKPRTRLGTIHAAEQISTGTQLSFKIESNAVMVSTRQLGADCERTTKQRCDRNAGPQQTPVLPEGISLDNFTGSVKQKEEALRILAEYKDVFAREGEEISCTPTMQHRIATMDDQPVAQHHRRILPNLFAEVKQHLQELLDNGVIVPSQSDYASAIVLARKKSGTLRLCVDYRLLNTKCRNDRFPLPRIEESLDVLGGAQHFSTIDLASAYNQVEVHPADRHKTAFTTPMGLYEYVRMPYGLSNAPVTFQRVMQIVFRDDVLQKLIVYLDDIITFSKDIDEHVARLKMVFEKLRQLGLKIEPKKCQFFSQRVS